RRAAVLPGRVRTGQDHGRRGVVGAGGVARGDRPFPGAGRLQPGQVSRGHTGPDVLVGVDGRGVLPAGDLDRRDLLGEVTRLDRRRRPPVALGGQRILDFPGYVVVGRHVLRGRAHVT